MQGEVMRKLTILAIGLVIFSILSAGCLSQTSGTTNTATPQAAGTRTITDLSNRTVEIPVTINKIAVFTSPLVQDMYIIGEQDKLCAITTATQKSQLLQKMDPRIANMSAPRSTVGNINMEELLKADPDICIGSNIDMEAVRNSTHIPTLEVTGNDASFNTIKSEVSYFGHLLGNDAKANAYNTYLDNKLALLTSKVSGISDDKRLKVYFGFNPDHLTTYGGDTFMQERIEAAGCKNAARNVSTLGGSEGGLQTVSMEQILSWDPDIIVIDYGKPEDLYNSSQWNKISAVKNKRVYVLPQGMFLWNRPSAESAVLLPEWLAITAYPDQFKDMSAQNEIKQFYKEIFGYDLSEQDLKGILNPAPLSGPGSGTGMGGGMGGGKGSGSGSGNATAPKN
jgi:iron complex transport system substrate-binding protein